MMTISMSTLQIIYLVCLAVLFLLLLIVLSFFLRLVIKWTKVAELLNKKMESGWHLLDFTKLAALKNVIVGALPYVVSWIEQVTQKSKKTKNKK
jgi:hypothetical protein